jgi:thioredoxin-related protein
MRKKNISIFMIWTCILSLAQNSFTQIITYPFEQLDSLQKTEKRNIIVFIHTDWCKYCQLMKNTTLKDDRVIKLLNDKFYFVDLNAEEKRNIVFNRHNFKYKPTGANTGTHELADQLGNFEDKLSYPTLCILNADYEIIFQYPEYMNVKDLKDFLTRLD